MTAFLTTVVLIAFFGALAYMAKDLIGKNKEVRKPPMAMKENRPARKLITHEIRQLTQEAPEEKPIATKEELLQFWTEVMKDTKNDIETRLKASELLGLYYSE